jgi:hypothetical protein
MTRVTARFDGAGFVYRLILGADEIAPKGAEAMRHGQGQGVRGVCGWVAWTGAWWSRFLLASAVAFGIATPAVALARSGGADTAAAADTRDMAGSAAASEQTAKESAAETMCQCQSCAPQAAAQSHAQSDYQPGTSRAMAPETPEHPYAQSHYQLGAGHQD